jgi:hypothetical protein
VQLLSSIVMISIFRSVLPKNLTDAIANFIGRRRLILRTLKYSRQNSLKSQNYGFFFMSKYS